MSVNRFCPLARTKPRWAMASACLAFCSTMRMLTPRRLMAMMRSKISDMKRGDSPAVGSSSSKRRGTVISARPIATI